MAKQERPWLEACLERRKEACGWWDKDWKRAEQNYAFYRGKHKTKAQADRLKRAERADVNWSDMARIINSATGRQVVQRYQPALRGRIKRLKQVPPEQMLVTMMQQAGLSNETQARVVQDLSDDTPIAQALTELLRWMRQLAEADIEVSSAFLDTFVCGFANLEIAADWSEDPAPRIVWDALAPWEVAWDPRSRKRNFRDAEYLFRLREMSKEEAERAFGKDRIRELGSVVDQNAVQVEPRAATDKPLYDLGSGGGWNPITRRFVATEYLWREKATHHEVVDPRDGSVKNFIDEDQLRAFKAELRSTRNLPPDAVANLVDIESQKSTHYRAVLLGDGVVKEKKTTSVNAFPILGITCFPWKAKEGTRWFGLVDLGKDPQLWADRMMGASIDYISRSPKAQVYFEEGAVEDEEQFKSEVARDDAAIKLSSNAIARKKILFAQPGTMPRGLEAIFNYAKAAVPSAMGIGDVASGMVDDPRRAPFGTVNLIAQLAQLNIAHPYDALSTFQRDSSKIALMFAAQFLSPQLVERVLGRELFEALPPPETESEFGKAILDFNKYDLVVDEQPHSPTMMRDLLQILTNSQTIEQMRMDGLTIPPAIWIDLLVESGMPALIGQEWKAAQAFAPVDGQPVDFGAIFGSTLASLSAEVRAVVESELQQIAARSNLAATGELPPATPAA